MFVPDGQVAGHCMKIVAEKGCVSERREDGRSLKLECSGKGLCWCPKGRWQVTEIRV